jgi:hypothetical protein
MTKTHSKKENLHQSNMKRTFPFKSPVLDHAFKFADVEQRIPAVAGFQRVK